MSDVAPSPRDLARAAVLGRFETFSFEYDGVARPVYTAGRGPAVIVMHEIPGLTPEVVAFAERVVDAGYRVYMPHLFGVPGKRMGTGYALGQIARACISKEFHVLASRGSSPITVWLRALCRHAHAEVGGIGVGAIGMCLTGNFALALMIDPSVMAPVLSQPSLPFTLPGLNAGLHVSDDELAIIKDRVCNEGLKVLGLRFTHDAMCPGSRFDNLRRELGDGFEGIEIDSSFGNPNGIPIYAHSVVTLDLVDEEGHPTRAALDRVMSFFAERLREPEGTV